MSYYVNGGGALKINKENFDKILVKASNLVDTQDFHVPADVKSMERLFRLWNIDLDFDNGNIMWAYMTYGNYTFPENDLFLIIAPYVNNGSYIDFSGEDGALWRLSFFNGELIETNGVVRFPGDPYDDGD